MQTIFLIILVVHVHIANADFSAEGTIFALIPDNGDCSKFYSKCEELCRDKNAFAASKSCGSSSIANLGSCFNKASCKCLCKNYPPTPKLLTTQSTIDFQNMMLQQHNYFRAFHSVQPLTINPTISQIAQRWANQLAATYQFRHSNAPDLGESLYTAISSTEPAGADFAVKEWYDEIKNYNFATGEQINRLGTVVGHFTQVCGFFLMNDLVIKLFLV